MGTDSNSIEYKINTATADQITYHLEFCKSNFKPALNETKDIEKFSRKIHKNAITFEAWEGNALIGLVAGYFNNIKERLGYITNVSVYNEYAGKGVASELMKRCIDHAKKLEFVVIDTEIPVSNTNALSLCEKFNFIKDGQDGDFFKMKLQLARDYNQESKDVVGRKYGYSFDFDVMHPFMIQSFIPFIIENTSGAFIERNALELGSYQGRFTERLLPLFNNNITCIEASEEAVKITKQKFDKICIINKRFEDEDLKLIGSFDNIFLTHVLEHIDDPVKVLKRINNEWLSKKGRLFLVCPNANAPSRQIAVKMGLISHNTAITEQEAAHGHKRTYTADTLEKDIRQAGLKVIHRSGIFFKALANFQWDQLLKTDIITKEYLEGCYQFGQLYPDLCASIFLVCEKGQ
jgi:2-polyprenyl-3-methyl-5-hydroxy-6-metoxy-1,4-benzoquinol methylase